ncbi:MAG: NAD-dependent epimerase/dehydratase family protein [Candidatus Hydrogenedentota bacterium]
MIDKISRYYSQKTVLVTGGTGFIGSNLVRMLLNIGTRRIIVLDNLVTSRRWNVPYDKKIIFIKGSVVEEKTLKKVFSYKPDIVFHLAAFCANQKSVEDPKEDLRVNGFGTLHICQFCIENKVDRLIYASAGCSIYGVSAPNPVKEDFPVSLIQETPYQITKLLGELYCNYFMTNYSLKVVTARFFNAYGPGEIPGYGRNVVSNFIYKAICGQNLPVMGTGRETRDFVYTEDLACAIIRCGYLDEAVNQIFNLSTGRQIEINYVADVIIDTVSRIFNKKRVKKYYIPLRKWDRLYRREASIDKARTILKYTPVMNFEQGIENTVYWFKENWERIIRDVKSINKNRKGWE